MAGATGLEPAASGVTGRRSNQLSYAPEGSAGLKARPVPSQEAPDCQQKGVRRADIGLIYGLFLVSDSTNPRFFANNRWCSLSESLKPRVVGQFLELT